MSLQAESECEKKCEKTDNSNLKTVFQPIGFSAEPWLRKHQNKRKSLETQGFQGYGGERGIRTPVRLLAN